MENVAGWAAFIFWAIVWFGSYLANKDAQDELADEEVGIRI